MKHLARSSCFFACLVVCPFAPVFGADHAAAASSAQLELMSRSVICNYPQTDPYDPENHYGFNHCPSIVKMPNGDLLCAWFSGPFEGAVNQVILASRSTDQGRTWGKASVLVDIPRKSDYDPAFLADGQRTWFFFSSGRWNRYPFVQNEHEGGVGPSSYHTFVRQSSDSGKSWSNPMPGPGTFFCRSDGIKLTSGELLLPVYTIQKNGDEDKDRVYWSADGGKTWKLGEGISTPGGTDEPSIAEVPGGRVLMIIRSHDGFLWRSYSDDKGRSWKTPQKDERMPAAAASANIFRLADGRIVLTHDECKPPLRTPLTMRISDDDGRTWGAPLSVAEAKADDPSAWPDNSALWDRQVTCPSVTQLDDGTLIVVWAKVGLGDTEQFGDIWSARIRVAPTKPR